MTARPGAAMRPLGPGAHSTGRRLSDVRPWYASIAERTWSYPGQP